MSDPAPRLRTTPITGSARKALEAGAGDDLSLLNHAVNCLMAGADQAESDGKLSLAGDLREKAGRLLMRKVELVVGKKMTMNLNLRTQEDLEPTAAFLRSLPPEQRAALDAALDLYAQLQQGTMLPATALSSTQVDVKPVDVTG